MTVTETLGLPSTCQGREEPKKGLLWEGQAVQVFRELHRSTRHKITSDACGPAGCRDVQPEHVQLPRALPRVEG